MNLIGILETGKSMLERAQSLEEKTRATAEAAQGMVDCVTDWHDRCVEEHKESVAFVVEVGALIGGKPTEDEIADTLPGGNGGTFKAKETLAKETLAKGHGVIETLRMEDIRRRFHSVPLFPYHQTCTAEEVEQGRKFYGKIFDKPPSTSDLTGGASDYAPDPEDKEGGTQ